MNTQGKTWGPGPMVFPLRQLVCFNISFPATLIGQFSVLPEACHKKVMFWVAIQDHMKKKLLCITIIFWFLFESLHYPASFQSLRNIFWGLLQHPLHVFLFDALTPLMNCCRALGDIGDAARVCTNIISCLDKVIPGYSLEVANFYFCLGEMYSERAESSNSLPAIAKRYRKQVHHFEAIGKKS